MRKMTAGFLILVLLAMPFFSHAEGELPAAMPQTVISRFLDKAIDPEAVTRPLNPETDLKMLRITATEAWLEHGPGTETLLYIAFKVDVKRADSLPVFLEQEHEDRIEYNGETITLEQFRGNKDLISCELVTGHSWAWYDYSDEGLYIISCIMNPDIISLNGGSGISFTCWCENLQTGETDKGTITVSLPPMTVH